MQKEGVLLSPKLYPWKCICHQNEKMLETVQKEKRLCFTPWFQDLCVGVKGYFICQSIWSANSKNFMWFNLKFSCHFHILSKICMVVKRSVFHDILLREDYLHLYSLIFPVKHIFLKGNILANVLIYSELGANLHLLLFLWHFVVFLWICTFEFSLIAWRSSTVF